MENELKGLTIAITGSTGGLGRNLSKDLAKIGANLIFVNRNIEKSEKLKNEILENCPTAKIEIVGCDLENKQSVDEAILVLKKMPLDIFVCNAGIYNVPRRKTTLGYDNIFQTNFLMHYYIVKELLPTLEKSDHAKVIVVGSIAYRFAKFREDDFEYLEVKGSSKVYGNSKRFLMGCFDELFENEGKVKFAIAHPGVTLTNMTNHYPKAINWLVKIGIKILFPSPKKATQNIIFAIENSCERGEWFGPRVFDIWGKPKKKKIKALSKNEKSAMQKIAEREYLKIKSS